MHVCHGKGCSDATSIVSTPGALAASLHFEACSLLYSEQQPCSPLGRPFYVSLTVVSVSCRPSKTEDKVTPVERQPIEEATALRWGYLVGWLCAASAAPPAVHSAQLRSQLRRQLTQAPTQPVAESTAQAAE